MTLIASIVSRFFLAWIMVLLGLGGLLLVFDMLANADNVLKYQTATLFPLAQYALLRFQQIVIFALPLSVLLSSMILLSKMVLSQEMIILRAVGISVYRVIFILLCATAAIVLMHSVFANTLLVKTNIALNQWQANDFKGKAEYKLRDVMNDWISAGSIFLHAEFISADGKQLRDVVVLQRSPTNAITYYLRAKTAFYDKGHWVMHGVKEATANSNADEIESAMQIKTLPFEPRTLSLMSVRENELSYGDLLDLIASVHDKENASKPYHFWFYHKIAQPFSSFIMLLIGAPLALQLARRNRLLMVSFTCVMAGFLYYVVQQLLASLGETGVLPPLLAASTPIVLGASMAGWVLLHFES